MSDEDDDGKVPGAAIMLAAGLVAIALGLALALMECHSGSAMDPGGGRSIHAKA